MALHPQDAAEVLVDFPRALALTAACEELPHLRMLVASEHKLIRSATTAGAGLPAYISPNGADSPFLFMHLVSP
jgi:hypothetical protein